MKKLMMVLLIAALAVVLAVSASATLTSPNYYGVEKVEAGSITVDGVVDEAYGTPIFSFVADGTDDPGDINSNANWFFTGDKSGGEDVLALIEVTENYAYGYAVWTDSALYLCIDTNILGWEYPDVPALTAQYMWRAFCVQFGLYDFNSGDNIDLGLAINEKYETIQRNFGQNRNGNDKYAPLPNSVKSADGNEENDQTDLNAKVTREGANVIYEVELPFAKFLSFIPQVGDSMGLDICIDFGDYNEDDASASIQKCLTFVNPSDKGYHTRDINYARPLYFVENREDAAALYADRANQEEARKDAASIALFGCNDVPAGTNFQLETEDKIAGNASLFLVINSGVANENKWTFDAVDGTGWDTLRFQMNVTDMSIFDITDSALELGSNGKACMSWSFADIKALNQGEDIKVGEWNTIILPIKQSADFDISKIDYLGLSFGAVELERALGVTIDSFRLSADQAILNAEAMADAAKVDTRIEKLNEITADNYISMNPKVQAARKAYEGLSDAAKMFVNAELLAKLEAAEAAIANFMENPPVDDEPDQPTEPDQPSEPTTPSEPTNPGKTDDSNGTIIVIIAVVAVVVIAGVVVLLVLKKKKA